MADYKKPTSSFLNSSRLFTNFIPKSFDSESIMSPTSILDFKSKNLWGPRGLIEALADDPSGPNLTRPVSGSVLFGPQLKIQVPSSVFSPSESPKSPSDFGIKTAQSHSGPFSRKPSFGPGLSATEMELSEDYTRVVSYGPNPKTTHIFDDCIVESCCGVVKFSESRKDDEFIIPTVDNSCYPSDSFLSCCCFCKKNLEQGCDIYMYRGEKAFCSDECRCKEMLMEEEEWMEVSEPKEV